MDEQREQGSKGARRDRGRRDGERLDFWLRNFLLLCQCDNSDEVKKAGSVLSLISLPSSLLLVIPAGPRGHPASSC